MKKVFIIFTLLAIFFSCDKEEESKDRSSLLVGKWQHDKTEYIQDGKIADIDIHEAGRYVTVFRMNGTGTTGVSEFTWILQENSLSLIGQTWSEDYTITTLTKTRLIMYEGTVANNQTFYQTKIE